MKKLQVLLLSTLIASPAVALADSNLEFYGKAGIPGVGVGVGAGVHDKVSVRADITTLGSINRDFKQNKIEYTAKVKATQGTIAIDYFPMTNSSFRLTTGVGMGRIKIDGEGRSTRPNGTIKIGGKSYSYDSSQDFVNAKIEYPDLMPYFGIGLGHNAKAKQAGSWGFNADLGVYVGDPKTNFQVSDSLYEKMLLANGNDAAATAVDIERERQRVKDKAGDLRVVPVASVGFSYYF